MVYAIVRAGGRQEKVEVGTIVVLDRIKADKDGNIELVPGAASSTVTRSPTTPRTSRRSR